MTHVLQHFNDKFVQYRETALNMSLIGNILWILLGGFIVAIMYFIAGLILCVTIIGIPFGLQLMKLGALALNPFGKSVELKPNPGVFSIIFGVLWIIFGWWEIAILHFVFALLCAITIIGIPFAKAHLRLAAMSFAPFGFTRA